MKRLVTAILVAFMSLLAPPARAQTYEYDKAIDVLGVIANLGYLTVVGGFSTSCTHGFVYIDLTTIGGRSTYATLLAAKLTGKQIESMGYAIEKRPVEPMQTLCYLFAAQIHD